MNDETRAAALKYVDNLHARGGTAIQEALEIALKQLGESDRLKMILFATDGLPTIGERDPDKLIKQIAKQNGQDVRVFVFGEGIDVNTKLLDFLALNNRGEAEYILPEENITEKISRFFDRVGAPVMTNLEVRFDGIEVTDVYPRRITDIFRGEQVIVFGRYKGHGTKTIQLAGMVNGRTETFEYTLDFPQASPDDTASFVPRLWAGKKVDFLLNEIRKTETPERELVDEITTLAKRYGIVTPYTSFLMAEDIVAQGNPQLAQRFQSKVRASGFANGTPSPTNSASSAPADVAKREQVEAAKELSDARRNAGKSGGADALYLQAESELKKQGRDESSLTQIRYIGSKTFYQSGQQWFESDYDPQKQKPADVKKVEIGSDEYFKLLMEDGRVAKYFALGDVVLQVGKQWYQFERRKGG